jgi:hypothetical protein
MFPLLSLLLSIFVTYLKKKMKENDFFFLENLDTSWVHMQKYPKSISTQKVSGTGTALFLEYPGFIECRIEYTIIISEHDEYSDNIDKIIKTKLIEISLVNDSHESDLR